MKKISNAARKHLATGIASVAALRSSGGHICQDAFVLCKNGAVVRAYFDGSEPLDKQITHAKVARISWRTALNDASNS